MNTIRRISLTMPRYCGNGNRSFVKKIFSLIDSHIGDKIRF